MPFKSIINEFSCSFWEFKHSKMCPLKALPCRKWCYKTPWILIYCFCNETRPSLCQSINVSHCIVSGVLPVWILPILQVKYVLNLNILLASSLKDTLNHTESVWQFCNIPSLTLQKITTYACNAQGWENAIFPQKYG